MDVEQKALPTMCVVLGGGVGAGPDSPMAKIGTYNPALLVHGEQGFTLHKPLPVEATVSSVSRITGIYDKGKAALVVLESDATDTADDQPLFTTTTSLFIRGEGGWGGDRGPAGARRRFPSGTPTTWSPTQTRTDQALLYRLNGDRNPLHSDPSFAAAGGFDTPHPARPVYLRLHRSGAAARPVRRRSGPLQVDARTVLLAGAAGRDAGCPHLGRGRRVGPVPDPGRTTEWCSTPGTATFELAARGRSKPEFAGGLRLATRRTRCRCSGRPAR